MRWRRRKTSFGSSGWVDGPPWINGIMHYNKISIMNNVIMIFLNVRVSRVSSWVSGPPWICRILNVMMIHDNVIMAYLISGRRRLSQTK